MITQGKGWKQTVHRWSKKQNFQNNSSIIYVPMASFETGGSYFCSSSAAFRFFMTAAAAAARTSLPVLWRRPLRPLPSINKCYCSNTRFIYLLTYMGVFDLGQTRAACSDGFFDHCIFVSPCYCYRRGRFLRQAFFDICLCLGVWLQNAQGIKAWIRI